VVEGHSIASSIGFALLMALGGPIGSAIGAWSAGHFDRKLAITVTSGLCVVLIVAFLSVRTTAMMPVIGFLLTIPIYVLVALLFAVYVPELFPTALRLRGVGICNAVGRSASIIVPLLIGPLFSDFGISGVLVAMSCVLGVMGVVVGLLGVETHVRQ